MLTPSAASAEDQIPASGSDPPLLGNLVTSQGRDSEPLEKLETSAASKGLANPPGLINALIGGAWSVVRDPRTVGVLRAAPRVGTFLVRSGVRSARSHNDKSIIAVRPTPLLALEAYLDEVLIAVFHHPDLEPKEEDYAPAAAELSLARELFSARGWLDNPEDYHRDPPVPDEVRAWHERAPGLDFEHTTFSSGWEPDPAEPGRERWLRHEANRMVHAWVSRTPGSENRSWLVCGHGFGMGMNAFMDLRAFRAPQLHRMGVNLAVPVLPLHGPRASGRVRGEDLMTIDLVDSLHGVAQAAWDLRRLIRWLRATQGAEKVGVIGYSFGALVTSLVASLEPDLACVISGIPIVDLPDLFRRHSRPAVARLADEYGVLGTFGDDVHRVASPLAMRCKVPFERRYIFAGLGDRMSTFGQARRLWLHWDRPSLTVYPGSHVGFFWSRSVRQIVDEAIKTWLGP